MPVITAITSQKRRSGRFSIFLDNEFFLGVDEEVLHILKLKEGQNVTSSELKDWVSREEYHRAKQYIFGLLSRRLYTCHEIRTKLNRKEYEPEITEKLISDFITRKFLDDRTFAESWVENRLIHRPRGPVVLRQELRKKGIDREIIDEVLVKLQSTDEQVELAQKALAKKKNYQNEKESIKRRRKI